MPGVAGVFRVITKRPVRWEGRGTAEKVWLGHFHKHRLLSTPILLFENVRRAPTGLFSVNLPGYHIQRIEVDPGDVGWRLVQRPRSFFLCTHRGLVDVKYDWAALYKEVCKPFDSICTSPRHALLAPPEEVHEEAMHYAELRRKRWSNDWEGLLNDREVASKDEYNRIHHARYARPSGPDDVWNLGDNAWSRCNWSEVSGRIPTYRLHNQLYWYPAVRRPMTIMEKVATLAWPVYPAMMVDPSMGRVMPSREEAAHMLGNAWHLANGTVAMMTALASLSLRV